MQKFNLSYATCSALFDPFTVNNLICRGFWPSNFDCIYYLISVDLFVLRDSLRKRLPSSSSRGFIKSLEEFSTAWGRVNIVIKLIKSGVHDPEDVLSYMFSKEGLQKQVFLRVVVSVVKAVLLYMSIAACHL